MTNMLGDLKVFEYLNSSSNVASFILPAQVFMNKKNRFIQCYTAKIHSPYYIQINSLTQTPSLSYEHWKSSTFYMQNSYR